MELHTDTPITVSMPQGWQDHTFETTWGQFAADNADDPEMLSNIAAQIAIDNYAEIGGGAAPLTWIFA